MKAMIYTRYGGPDVVHAAELAKPVVHEHDVLIEVHATTVTSADARIRALNMPLGFGLLSRLIFGVRAPRQQVLGVELAGVVVEVGRRVTRFRVGEAVFGICGMNMGCHAEYRALRDNAALTTIPEGLSFEQAAALCFGGTTALDFFRRAKLQSGERVLVNGAAGAVGTAAVQIAKHRGAHVTAVCGPANVEFLRALGADAVIDYTQEDFTRGAQRYDVIMDAVGTAPYSGAKTSLEPRGRLLLVLAGLPQLLSAPWYNVTTSHTVIAGPVLERVEDVKELAALAAQGHYLPVIGRVFPLAQAATAHALVDTGHKRGNVVLVVK